VRLDVALGRREVRVAGQRLHVPQGAADRRDLSSGVWCKAAEAQDRERDRAVTAAGTIKGSGAQLTQPRFRRNKLLVFSDGGFVLTVSRNAPTADEPAGRFLCAGDCRSLWSPYVAFTPTKDSPAFMLRRQKQGGKP
jgi:hypothetical protein